MCSDCNCCHPECNDFIANQPSEEGGLQEVMPCVTTACHISYSCIWNDPPLTAPQIASIWNRLVTEEPKQIKAVLREYPHHVELNRSRNSIQIVRCRTVVANVPLAPALIAAFDEAPTAGTH